MRMRPLHPLVLLLLSGLADLARGQYNVQRTDPFAVLSATLETKQTAACDNQMLNLECPAGTKVSIQLVQYGRSAPSDQVCPPTPEFPRVYTGAGGSSDLLECSFPHALKIVEEKCHSQEMCSMIAAPEVFGGSGSGSGSFKDPCPGYRKYVEVAFKCAPTQFKSKVVCHGDTLDLSCDRADDRLAIYSAGFASAAGSHIYCPVRFNVARLGGGAGDYLSAAAARGQKGGKFESGTSLAAKCQSSSATEAVMQICHGQDSCVVTAEGSALGAPACSLSQNVYLKTVYACVNKGVFKASYREGRGNIDAGSSSTSTTTPVSSTTAATSTEAVGEDKDEEGKMLGDLSTVFQQQHQVPKQQKTTSLEAAVAPDVSKVEEVDTPTDKQTDMAVGFVSNFMSSYQHIRQHKAKFILFVSLSVALGLAFFLAMLVWGMYRTSRFARIKSDNEQARALAASNGSMSGSNGDTAGRRNRFRHRQPPRPPSTIHAYYASSPSAGSPINAPPSGTVDIEVEVGDHEVDTAFRDPAPDPLIVRTPCSPTVYTGTLGRNSHVDMHIATSPVYNGDGTGTLRRNHAALPSSPCFEDGGAGTGTLRRNCLNTAADVDAICLARLGPTGACGSGNGTLLRSGLEPSPSPSQPVSPVAESYQVQLEAISDPRLTSPAEVYNGVAPVYSGNGTLRRMSREHNSNSSSDGNGGLIPHTCDLSWNPMHQQREEPLHEPPKLAPAPPVGILRHSTSRDSPSSSEGNNNQKVVRYSTVGRPRVSSPPGGGLRAPLVDDGSVNGAGAGGDDSDIASSAADLRNLTLTHGVSGSQDAILYG